MEENYKICFRNIEKLWNVSIYFNDVKNILNCEIKKDSFGKENLIFNPKIIYGTNDFEKQKNQNILRDSDIEKIIRSYKSRENVEKYAHLASFEEIESNDFNLNIPRYVDTFEEEEPIDIIALSQEIVDINQEISKTEQEFLSMLNQLAVTNDSREIIEATKRIFGE